MTCDGFYNPLAMDIEQKIQELKRRDYLAEEGGGKERRERQHKEGKMSARERISSCLTRVRSKKPIDSSLTAPTTLGWLSANITAMVLSPVTGASMGAWYLFSRRTSRYSGAHSPRPTPARS